jgi:hypothetical protein
MEGAITPDARPAEATGRGPPGAAPPGGTDAANDLAPRTETGPVPAGPGPVVTPGAIARVRQLQDDLRVLMQHVAARIGRSDVPGPPAVAAGAESGGPAAASVPAGFEVHAGLLVLAAEEIARDGVLLGQLYASIGALTRLAAPAEVASIRITLAFLRGGGAVDEEAPGYAQAAARRLLRWARASALLCLFVFFAAVALLVHVDRGRRAVQQLEQVRAEYRVAADSFTVPRAGSSQGALGAAGAAAECRDELEGGPAAPGAQGRAAPQPPPHSCERLRDVLLRMAIVYRELRAWNTISERLDYASPIAWLEPRFGPEAGLPEEHWQSTELRTTIMMATLTGFVLPTMLGLLGACVYVYRQLDGQIEAFALDGREGGARDAAHAVRGHPGRAPGHDLDQRRDGPGGGRAAVPGRARLLHRLQRRGGVPPGGRAGARRRRPDQQAGGLTARRRAARRRQADGAPCSIASAACSRRRVRSSHPRPYRSNSARPR